MDRRARGRQFAAWFFGGVLLCGTDTAWAQPPPSDRNQKAGQTAGGQPKTQAAAEKLGQPQAGRSRGAAQAPGEPRLGSRHRDEFSEAYRESLRRTVEKRRAAPCSSSGWEPRLPSRPARSYLGPCHPP